MKKQPAVAIFDVGKTNKKLLLFDENYQIVFEKSARFNETIDEDGDPCENLKILSLSVFDSLREVFKLPDFDIKAINFSTYGASLVYIDENGSPLTPLYNYLKPYPEYIKKKFYDTYGGESEFSKITASPVLGSLNSGMQLYRIKCEKPELFRRLKYALHLPQYLSYLFTGKAYSDITSIGCHTNLWDFTKKSYHRWVDMEGVGNKLAPIIHSQSVIPPVLPGSNYLVGIGLHDSSAALIPYLVNFNEPFVLISTGTWCISLNPYNRSPLTGEELLNDCLFYMEYRGNPVKASRLFAGFEHENQVKRIASHFQQNVVKYRSIEFDPEMIQKLIRKNQLKLNMTEDEKRIQGCAFAQRDLSSFDSDVEAYHQLMFDLVSQQYQSTNLVLKGSETKRIFVDGGFSKNSVYMNLLPIFFPHLEIFAASMAQATSVGAALAIHLHWNNRPVPNDIIELKYYSINHQKVK